MSVKVDMSPAAIHDRRHQSHLGHLRSLRQHQGIQRDRIARALGDHDEAKAFLDDPNPNFRANAADALIAADGTLAEARAELAVINRKIDDELERFHAGDHPPDPLQGEAELDEAMANLDTEQALVQEADGLPGGAGLRRRAERLRSHAATLRASLCVARPTLGVTVARRSPASSGRPRARRTASAARAGPGDDPGSDEPEPGDAGHPHLLAAFGEALADRGATPAERLTAFYKLPADAQAAAWRSLRRAIDRDRDHEG